MKFNSQIIIFKTTDSMQLFLFDKILSQGTKKNIRSSTWRNSLWPHAPVRRPQKPWICYFNANFFNIFCVWMCINVRTVIDNHPYYLMAGMFFWRIPTSCWKKRWVSGHMVCFLHQKLVNLSSFHKVSMESEKNAVLLKISLLLPKRSVLW